MPRFVQGVAVGHEDRGRRARFRLLVSRRRLVGTLALVLLAGVLTRYARDRPGQSVLIGHSIDRSTIAYQLSAATPEEIKELVALQRSLGTDAISVDKGDGTDPFTSESTRVEGAGGGLGGGGEKKGRNTGGGTDDGLDYDAGPFDKPKKRKGGGGGAGIGNSANAVGDGSCDAVLEDKIRAVEKQAQRWQSMVLQRAQEHADAAAAKACHGDRHVVTPETEPESEPEEKKSSKNSIDSLIGAAAANFATKGGSAMLHHTVVPGDASVVWQREVLGVCIPYRDRRDQLEVFASHLRTFLHGQGVPFRIYVGEQMAGGAFNRGWAINVAYKFAEPEVDYVVFHDVDMLPLPGVDYRYNSMEGMDARHLSTEISQFDYKIPYNRYCSGVFMSRKEFFRDINGFATTFWGWGGEDDEFCARWAKKKFGGWEAAEAAPGGLHNMFGRPEKGRGRFISMQAGHKSDRKNPHWRKNDQKLQQFLNSKEAVNKADGLSTTGEPTQILKGKVETPLYTVYRSAFPPNLRQP